MYLKQSFRFGKKKSPGPQEKGQIIYKGKTVKLVSGFTTTYKEREAKAFLKIHLQIWTTGCWLPWGGVGGMGETDEGNKGVQTASGKVIGMQVQHIEYNQ